MGFALITTAIVAGLGAIAYWMPRWPLQPLASAMMPSVITHFETAMKNEFALTIDDVTQGEVDAFCEILDILVQTEHKVTFFVISDCKTNPRSVALLKRAIKEGHLLSNHGMTNRMHARLSAKDLQQEIDDCDTFIQSLYDSCGIPRPRPLYYRPGSGMISTPMFKLSPIHYVTLGNIYPHDPAIRFPLINYLYLKGHPVHDGDIVILHNRQWTPALLRMWLPTLEHRSFPLNYFDKV